MSRYLFSTQPANPTSSFWQSWQHKAASWPAEVLNTVNYGPVLDQGQIGDCGSVSSRRARYGARILAGLSAIPTSDAAHYDKARQLMGTFPKDSGQTVEVMAQVWEQFGAIPLSEYPDSAQDFSQLPPDNLWDASWKLDPKNVFHGSTLEDYKDACAAGYLVLVAFQVPQEFESRMAGNIGWVPDPPATPNIIGGHLLCGGGYSDSMQRVLWDNQWGAGWGIKNDPRLAGCAWLSYDFFRRFVMDIIIIAPDSGTTPPKPNTNPGFIKPEVDNYTAAASLDKSHVNVGEPVTLTLTYHKNGLPIVGESPDYFVFNQAASKGWEANDLKTDVNGQIHYTYTPETADIWTGGTHWFDPYGDMVYASAQFVSIAPQVYPSEETDLVEHHQGIARNGDTYVPPELWQRVGQATQTGSNTFTVNGKTYPGAVQNGVTYIHYQVMKDAGYALTRIANGWTFIK